MLNGVPTKLPLLLMNCPYICHPVFAFNGVNNLDSQLGVEPVGPDGCFDIKSDGQRLVLFGQGKAGDDPNFDSLLMRLEQDNLFRNGFEDPN